MHDTASNLSPRRERRTIGVITAALLALVAAITLAGLLFESFQRGLVRPPAFAVELGTQIIAAPCPPEMGCDEHPPYYAVWQGQRHPDGSTSYELRYFTFLPNPRRGR